MLNPITAEDKGFLVETENYALLGKIAVATKKKDEAALKTFKAEVNKLRGVESFTTEQAATIGTAVKAGKQVNGKDILACLSNGREVNKAFRVAAGLTKE